MAADIRLCPIDRDPPEGEQFIPGDPALLADGWVRRHMVDPARAEETTELYTALGFEVIAQNLTPADFGAQCRLCAESGCDSYVLIYTRKRKST